jgi:hypothetical protein
MDEGTSDLIALDRKHGHDAKSYCRLQRLLSDFFMAHVGPPPRCQSRWRGVHVPASEHRGIYLMAFAIATKQAGNPSTLIEPT